MYSSGETTSVKEACNLSLYMSFGLVLYQLSMFSHIIAILMLVSHESTYGVQKYSSIVYNTLLIWP